MKAVITGDIVAYTSLSDGDRILLDKALRHLTSELNSVFDVFARVIRGDYIECVVSDSREALQVALSIKSFVKSIPFEKNFSKKTNGRVKAFKTYGIRLAIGYGKLDRYDPEKGIIDGEAIYLAGRMINEFSTYKKGKIIIKNTLFFVSNDKKLNNRLEPVISLLDVVMNKATSKQSKVLSLKLMKKNEEEIARQLKISQSAVNQHSTSVGWNAIEKSIKYFDGLLKE
jgi:hypothetical protein